MPSDSLFSDSSSDSTKESDGLRLSARFVVRFRKFDVSKDVNVRRFLTPQDILDPIKTPIDVWHQDDIYRRNRSDRLKMTGRESIPIDHKLVGNLYEVDELFK